MDAVRSLALDHRILSGFGKLSYVTSLIHATSRMKIDDEQIWTSFASFIALKHDQFSSRDLSNQVFALSKINKIKPVILNFDDLFKMLELSFVKKFDLEPVDG